MGIDKQRLCSCLTRRLFCVRVAISSLAQSHASCANMAVDALLRSFLHIAAGAWELRLMVVSLCVECSWGVSYMHDVCAAHFVDRSQLQEIGNNHTPVMRHRTKFLRILSVRMPPSSKSSPIPALVACAATSSGVVRTKQLDTVIEVLLTMRCWRCWGRRE